MSFFDGTIRSDVLRMRTNVTIISPFDISDVKREDCPVLYLLHGLSDDRTCWWRYTAVERYANARNMILIMPEVQRGFYTDMKYGLPYFEYITKELPAIIERMTGLTHRREKTFVAGLSMGGYGALKCALTYPDFYGACAGFSSAASAKRGSETDLMSESEVTAVMGDCLLPENDLIVLAQRLKTKVDAGEAKYPGIYTTCGLEDFLYEDNQIFNGALDGLQIPHTYEEWHGGHQWGFWDDSVKRAIKFFLPN